MKIIFTTFFKEIGRGDWGHFNRSTDLYVGRFKKLAEKIQYDFVVYLEPEIIDQLSKELGDKPNIFLKDINKADSTYADFLAKDETIIASESYQSKIPNHRKENPEHRFPKYNSIMNSKISFLKNTYDMFKDYDFYAWIDFGILQGDDSSDFPLIPDNLDLENLPFGVTYGAQIIPTTRNSFEDMLASDDIYFDGSSFVVYRGVLFRFYDAWKLKVDEMHTQLITDDDQNVVLQVYYDHPNIFNIIKCDWFHLYHCLRNE
jgi:hypothetical protein